MRRYSRYFLALLLFVVSAWFFLPTVLNKIKAGFYRLQTADIHTLSATASSSLVYPIKDEQWLTFAIPEKSAQLRIITNAHVKRTDVQLALTQIRQANVMTQAPNWAYAIHYELLDAKKSLLTSGVYHQRSKVTFYKDSDGSSVTNNYYANQHIVPLDGRLILLNLQTMKDVAFLRIRLESIHPAISEIAVRAYVPAKIAEQRVASSWLRLIQEQKDKLAESSVYPAALLSASEQLNLIRNQRQPLGPVGIEGKDYVTLNLYTLEEKELDNQEPPVLAAGLQADATHYAVIPLPEKGGQLGLTAKALDGSALVKPVAVRMQWYGRDRTQRLVAETALDGTERYYEMAGGLLVIQATSPIIINASLSTASEAKHDITDTLLVVKTYVSSFGVDFNIVHNTQQPAALRIDVRRLLNPSLTSQQQRVRYQWLDDQQHIIASGELMALELPSAFDRIADMTDVNRVSDPLSYYFHLPKQVSRVRLFSDTPALLVSAYNQAAGVTKLQRVPEDAYIDTEPQNLNLTWFPLRAANETALTQQLAVQWLIGQYRPPEETPDIFAGAYLWQDFIPQGQVAGFQLLTKFTEEQVRPDAQLSVYCELVTHQNVPITLVANSGLQSITPELIFLRTSNQPFKAELLVNQEKVLTVNSMGQQGVINLPDIAVGKQQLRLTTDSGGRWLMNHQQHCAGQRWLKRRAFSLTADTPLEFIVPHGALDETLTAHFYSPLNTIERSQIKVNIEAIDVAPATDFAFINWTDTNRLYDIRPLLSDPITMLYNQKQRSNNSERIAIPINSDLPAGTYRVRLSLIQGSAGLVTLSLVNAGIYDQRRFFQERPIKTH